VFARVSLGTNTRERMNVSMISGVVVWQLKFDVFGDFELNVECVFLLKRVHAALWEFRRFWDQGDTGE
jgi:hypothetical protein